jgi:hypothetical protein
MPKLKLKDSSLWVKFKARWKSSWTVIWGILQTGFGSIQLLFQQLGTTFNDPDFKSAINAITLPAYVATLISIFGIITIVVRLRKQSPDPIV